MQKSDEPKNTLYRNPWLVVIVIIILGVGVKVFLLVTDRLPFNADEAVVGLMADHILRGELPIFFYGQAYMGSLDALLVAGSFLVIGRSVLAIRIIQILLFCGTLATTYLLALHFTRKVEVGWIALLLLAIPSVNFTLYTTISLGGYGEALLLGNLILLSGYSIIKNPKLLTLILLGVLMGFGVWVNGLTLVYSIPVISCAMWERFNKRDTTHRYNLYHQLILILIGVLLGALPWWIYGLQTGFDSLIGELFGSAISSGEPAYITSLALRLVSFIIFGLSVIFGLRPPWGIQWLLLPVMPLIIAIWAFILIGFNKLVRKNPELIGPALLMMGVMLTTIGGFILTSFGNDPSGRYFLPFAVPLSIIAGIYLTYSQTYLHRWRWVVLIILIGYNLGGIFQCWQRTPPGFTTQFDAKTIYDHRFTSTLMEFLCENSITRGYTTYWISYPLVFLSNEELIFVPKLPYHDDFRYTNRDDRYPQYDEMVANAEQIAFITADQPWMDIYLKKQFDQQSITYLEMKMGDFTVFYHLSEIITPEELGIIEKNISIGN